METAPQTRGTAFSWKPLIAIPEVIPSATYIQGTDAEAFLAEFNATAKEQYGDAAKSIAVLTYDPKSKTVRGSNPFAVAHADSLLKSQGIRVATMADLERVLTTNAFDLRETYEDTALVLRSNEDPNAYLANNLVEQLESRGTRVAKTPIVVQLRGLNMVKDANSDYGLAFQLTDESQIAEAPYLVEKNNGKTFNKMDENGVPILDKNGSRSLWTRIGGLSRLYLGGDLNVVSDCEDLASSNEDGRVALVRGQSAGANFVQAKYDAAKTELATQMQTAQGILDKARVEALNVFYQKK